jgi:DNA-binding beta-propeller fold protein YncE
MTVLHTNTRMPIFHRVFGDPTMWVESATDQSQLSIVTKDFSSGDQPTALAVSYSRGEVFYVDINSRSIKMIDITTNSVLSAYPTASANVCDVSF